MGKTLVIAEKKSVADDIAKAFGGGFEKAKTALESDEWVVTWAVGHLAELAEPEAYDKRFEKWRMADLPILPQRFEVVPRAEGSGKEQLAAIKKLVKRRDIERIVNACDAGREGELIFAYVMDVAGRPGVPVERAWFSSMTRQAIRDAFSHLRPGQELEPLEEAARSRSEADWVVGMNATRAATVKARSLGGVISLGRVQTPTLAILVRREKEIQAFTPTPYWLVEATFEPIDDAGRGRYRGRWFGEDGERLPEGPRAEAIARAVDGQTGRIAELRKRVQRTQPPLLYDLTALQREAAQWHGFTARRTLSAAQGCYEKAVLTYPRTSSRYLSTDMIPELRDIARHVGRGNMAYKRAADYVAKLDELPLGRVVNDAKVTDHHAIIPTNAPHDATLTEDERRIYDMAARRFLAAFHPEAVFENTTVITEVSGERFRSRGRVLLEAGWRAAYDRLPSEERAAQQTGDAPEDEQAEQDLPALREGEDVSCLEAASDARETKPPPRYGEAALLAAMEGAGKLIDDDELRDAMKDSGIGTPATRAATIERLIQVGYIIRDGRRLMPTQKGIQVIDLLDQHELTSPELTGKWEQRLLEMERGEASRDAFMRDIAQFAERTVTFLRDLPPEKTRFQRRNLGITCPRCGKGELIENRLGYGCSTWQSKEEPGCGFVVWKRIAGKTITEDVLRELIQNGRTKELSGFRSRAGKPFRAMLVLDPHGERTVSFEFKERRGGKPGEPAEQPAELAG